MEPLPSLLYVDALNYANAFFSLRRPHHRVDLAAKQIRVFARAAKASGVTLIVFIDATQATEEADTKWRTRRENEVVKGIQNMPQGLENLMRDCFQAEGVEVFYSTEHDNDDALAAHAQANNGAVLSQDKDFFRYRDSTFTVYSDFSVQRGRLVLTKAVEKAKNKHTPAKRDLVLDPLPNVVKEKPRFVDVRSRGVYRRGTGGPLVKELGNLHLQARPLRLALYSREGIAGPIREIFPTWDAQTKSVFWVEEDVEPSDDAEWKTLLDEPGKALERLFPKPWVKPQAVASKDWEKHLFSMHSIVFEMCLMGGGVKSPANATLVSLITDAYKSEMAKDATAGVDSLTENLSSLGINSRTDTSGLPPVQFTCVQCHQEAQMSGGEVQFFKDKGFALPKRCKPCRKARRS